MADRNFINPRGNRKSQRDNSIWHRQIFSSHFGRTQGLPSTPLDVWEILRTLEELIVTVDEDEEVEEDVAEEEEEEDEDDIIRTSEKCSVALWEDFTSEKLSRLLLLDWASDMPSITPPVDWTTSVAMATCLTFNLLLCNEDWLCN